MKQFTGKTLARDKLVKSDAIICLEGDGYKRIPQTVKLFKEKLAGRIVISGGLDRPPFSILASKMAKIMVKKGVPNCKIIIEEKSLDTREQAEAVMKLAKERKWKKIILVGSLYHQLRVFLTFLKAMKEVKLKIKIFNAPAKIQDRKLLQKEMEKIKEYTKKGHIASFKEAIEYQKWKEQKK